LYRVINTCPANRLYMLLRNIFKGLTDETFYWTYLWLLRTNEG